MLQMQWVDLATWSLKICHKEIGENKVQVYPTKMLKGVLLLWIYRARKILPIA
jgi:hypothetical protein